MSRICILQCKQGVPLAKNGTFKTDMAFHHSVFTNFHAESKEHVKQYFLSRELVPLARAVGGQFNVTEYLRF